MNDRGGFLVTAGLAGLAAAFGLWIASEEFSHGRWRESLLILILVFLSTLTLVLGRAGR